MAWLLWEIRTVHAPLYSGDLGWAGAGRQAEGGSRKGVPRRSLSGAPADSAVLPWTRPATNSQTKAPRPHRGPASGYLPRLPLGKEGLWSAVTVFPAQPSGPSCLLPQAPCLHPVYSVGYHMPGPLSCLPGKAHPQPSPPEPPYPCVNSCSRSHTSLLGEPPCIVLRTPTQRGLPRW